MYKQLAAWLKRKGITIRDFSEKTGIDYGTAARWFAEDNPTTPGRMARVLIKIKYQDCPLLKG